MRTSVPRDFAACNASNATEAASAFCPCATTGGNALTQALQFHEAIGLTGIAITKLDGTAKGGILMAIAKRLSLPIRFVGVGEQIDDLQPFDAGAYAEALTGP